MKRMLVNLYAYKYVRIYCDRQVCYNIHSFPILLANFSIMLALTHSGHRISEEQIFFNLKKIPKGSDVVDILELNVS